MQTENEPMEDEEVEELYHGPQLGLSIRDHICQTFFG